jgi:hypothetical protein
VKSWTAAMWAVLSAGTIVQGSWAHYTGKSDPISWDLPSTWQVQNESTLEKSGYLQAPYPTYTLIAGAEPAQLDGVANPPSVYAFSETPSPWFMVLVERGASPAPPAAKAYELAPEGEMTIQEDQGLHPRLVSLAKPINVSSGGIHGSQDRSEVIVPGAGDIEMDEVVYAQGHTVWMTMAGCTVACYSANSGTLSRVINSVKVGPAAL